MSELLNLLGAAALIAVVFTGIGLAVLLIERNDRRPRRRRKARP